MSTTGTTPALAISQLHHQSATAPSHATLPVNGHLLIPYITDSFSELGEYKTVIIQSCKHRLCSAEKYYNVDHQFF